MTPETAEVTGGQVGDQYMTAFELLAQVFPPGDDDQPSADAAATDLLFEQLSPGPRPRPWSWYVRHLSGKPDLGLKAWTVDDGELIAYGKAATRELAQRDAERFALAYLVDWAYLTVEPVREVTCVELFYAARQ